MRTTRVDFQKFVKKDAVIHHRLTHFFRPGFPSLPSLRERSSRPVVLDDHGMIDGQVLGSSLEVLQRIAARGHDLGDELVRLADRAVRVVHEQRLDATPLARERIRLILSELSKIETADAIGSLAKNGVRTRGPDSLNGTVILGSESFSQVPAARTAHVGPDPKHEQQHDHTGTHKHQSL